MNLIPAATLAIAGVTNAVTMPVLVLPEANGRLRVSGGMPLKMTWFGIEPPDLNLVVGHIKVGDEVSIKFDWVVAPSSTSSNLAQHGLVPLVLELPAPAFKGTPKDLQLGPNVEPLSDKPRAPMMVPSGLQNLAPDSALTSSDKNVTADTLAKLTDGDKAASDQSKSGDRRPAAALHRPKRSGESERRPAAAPPDRRETRHRKSARRRTR